MCITGLIEYRIVSGNEYGKFVIDEISGELTVADMFDFDTTDKSFALDIMAVNNDGTDRNSIVKVAVEIDDVNDNSPTCTKSLYTASLAESEPVTSSVIVLECSDADTVGQPLSYSISSGNDAGYLNVGGTSGSIFIAKLLDAETQQKLDVMVDVSDGTFTTRVRVKITVLDANEHEPVFLPVTTTTLKEDTEVGSTLYTLTATDSDVSNTTFIYAIVGGDVDSHFIVGSTTGVIQLQKGLDREMVDTYTLTLQVADGIGIGVLSSTIELIFVIEDVNDNYPTCDQSTYTITLPEGSLNQTLVRPICSDLDTVASPMLNYKIISGNEEGKFAIDDSTGKLNLIGDLDYEITTMYTLTCEIDDQGDPNHITTIDIIVHVDPVNEFKPVFIDADTFDKSVDETLSVGSLITVINAVDQDIGKEHATIRFSLINGNINNQFSINPVTGKITLLKALDFETVNAYSLTVRAQDSLGSQEERRTDTIVNIVVIDVNDNTPLCSPSLLSETYDENYPIRSPLLQLNCTDDDTSEEFHALNYDIASVNGDASATGQFAISNTGVLTLETEFDYELTKAFNILIRTFDNGSPALLTTATVQLTVNNVNEHSPIFTMPTYTVNLKEKTSIGSLVTTVKATDNDINDIVTYYFDPASDQFSIDPATGDIYLVSDIDYDTIGPIKTISLTVFGKDDGINPAPQSSSVSVIITIINENDGTPIFVPGVYTAVISENEENEKLVTTVTATDIDDTNINYILFSGNEDNVFRIDQVDSEGLLIISDNTQLDFEQRRSYTLIVHAVDQGFLTGTTTVAIEVTGYNEDTPDLGSVSSTQTVPEEIDLGFLVIDLDAQDSDHGLDGEIYYTITSGNREKFTVEQTSGRVTVAGILDRESAESYTVEITVSDKGVIPGIIV